MPLEVAWRLMFRVNDEVKANCCLDRALQVVPASWSGKVEPYWKMPELWEVSLRSSFALPASNGVFETLTIAGQLGMSWNVTGPLIDNESDVTFEGAFSAEHGRPHITGLNWASFSVAKFPSIAQ